MTLLSQLNPMLRGAMHSGSELLNSVSKLMYRFSSQNYSTSFENEQPLRVFSAEGTRMFVV